MATKLGFMSGRVMPVGNTYRGLFSDWFNARNISKEDFARQIQMNDYQNAFNANEAQKQRDFEERMSNTSIQRMVADAESAGINPIFAFGQGGASTPSGASASGSSSQVRGTVADTGEFLNVLGTVLSIATGMYTAGASNATKMAIAKGNNATSLEVANTVRKSMSYSYQFGKKNKRK